MSGHLDVAQLQQLLEQRLSGARSQQAEAHLEECPECRRELEQLIAPLPALLVAHRLLLPATDPDDTRRTVPPRQPPSAEDDAGWPVLPGYEILGELGRGGMGVVYKARDIGLNRLVALKMILHGDCASADDRSRFLAEAEAVARLQHPNIVQVYEVGEHDGKPFFALEFCAGGSLDDRLAGTPLPAREAAELTRVLAQAVQAAHDAQVIHRDLKPGNVLLASGGRQSPVERPPTGGSRPPLADFVPKISDFGLARRLDQPGQTASGAVIGTASYMAPEQAQGQGKHVGPAADVYALGAILYELLTGRPPFRGTTMLDTLAQVRFAEPVPVRRLQPRVPCDLETVCLKCLQKEPGRRYPTAQALAGDLGRFLDGHPVEARPVGSLERLGRWCRRKPVVASLAAALVIVALGGLGAGAWALAERFRAAQAEREAAVRRSQQAEALAQAEKEKSDRIRSETLPLLERAATLRAQGFHQAAALYLARALPNNDDPRIRAQWLEDMQRSLVPVETSSRRTRAAHERATFPLGTSAFCPDRHLLITTNDGAEDLLRAVDTRTLREQRSYRGLRPGKHSLFRVSALAMHPHGSHFVSAEPDGALLWWSTDSGKHERAPEAHQPHDPHKLADLFRRVSDGVRRGGMQPEAGVVEQAERGDYSWLAVTALAWSRDGKRVASAGVDGTLKLWSFPDRRLLARWQEEPPSGEVRGMAPEVADVLKSGRLLWTLQGTLEVPQTVLLFDRGGDQLISAGSDEVLRIWNVGEDTARVVERLAGHARRVNAAALSGDGQLLASGSEDGFVGVWDLKKRRLLQMVHLAPLRGPGPLRPLARLTEPDLGLLEAEVKESYRVVRSLAFSPDGLWLAVVLQDGSLSLLNVTAGTVVYRGVGHETDGRGRSSVTAYFTREGELVTVGGDGTVRHWDLPVWSTGRRVHTAPLAEVAPVSRSFDPDGCVLLAGGAVQHWGPRTGRLQKEWADPSDKQNLASTLSAGRRDGKIVLITARRQVLVLDLTAGKIIAEFKGRDGKRQPLAGPLRSYRPDLPVAVQPKGPLAASAWEDGSVDVWHLSSGKWLRTLEGGQGRVAGVAFHPDGRQLAVAYADGPLRLWDVESGRPRSPDLLGPKNACGLCYSPDGSRLVQSGDQPTIAVWAPDSGRRLHTLSGHRTVSGFTPGAIALIKGAAFSPDGKWLASGGGDGTIRLWDASTFQPLVVLAAVTIKAIFPHRPELADRRAGISSLTFTADSRQLVAVGLSGSVRVYDLKPVADLLDRPARELLATTEQVTGLRLATDGQLVPLPLNRRAREGKSLRPTYERHFWEAFESYTQISRRVYQQGRYREGRDELKRLLQEPGVPGRVEEYARTALGHCYLNLGDFARARAEARKVLRLNPINTLARTLQAQVASREGRPAEAVALLRKMLAEPGLLPEAERAALGQLGPACTMLGWQQQTTGRFQQARESYRGACQVFQRLSRSLLDIPRLREDQVRRLRHGYSTSEGSVHFFLALLENDEGRPTEALVWLNSAIDRYRAVQKQDPGNFTVKAVLPGHYLARASTLSRLGRFREALGDLDEANRIDDGKRREQIRFRRAVVAAHEQGREPGAADLANYRQAAAEIKALEAGRPTPPGSWLYDTAVLYALFARGCRFDRDLAAERRKELAEQYAVRVVELLRQAQKARYFASRANRERLRTEKAFDALRSRGDFVKLQVR